MKSPIFIVGPHRSGSTLWHNLISMSPGIMRLTDMRFLSHWWQKDVAYYIKNSGDLRVDENVERMVGEMFANKVPKPAGLEAAFWRFENYGFVSNPEFQASVCEAIKKSDRSLRAIFRATIDELTKASGQERASVKFAVDIGHVPKLLEWYPDCKIVHITRDPRAMAMSRQNDPGGTAVKAAAHPRLALLIRRAMVALVVQQYCWTARLHKKYESLPNYRLFRYEELLDSPEATLRKVCEFVGCRFVPEMLQPERGIHKHQASTLTGKQREAFDKKAAGRWKEVMSPLDRWWISLVTRRSMRTLGYQPDGRALSAAQN